MKPLLNLHCKIILLIIAILFFISDLFPSADARELLPMETSFLIFLHDDHSYLYHDKNNRPRNPVQDILNKAENLAKSCSHCEIFIVHKHKEKTDKKHSNSKFSSNSLRFLDNKFNSTIYHYFSKNGEFDEKKWLLQKSWSDLLKTGVLLYKNHSIYNKIEDKELNRFLFYFGHHIPEYPVKGYSISNVEELFSLRDVIEALNVVAFQNGRDKEKYFDLITLSSCHNGTPLTVMSLAPYSKYIFASPEALHLSHLDLNAFENVFHETIPISKNKLMDIASKLYQSILENDKITATTIALYDSFKTANWPIDFIENYKNIVSTPLRIKRYRDCKDLNFLDFPDNSDLPLLLYNPPLFGFDQGKLFHSGWTCPEI